MVLLRTRKQVAAQLIRHAAYFKDMAKMIKKEEPTKVLGVTVNPPKWYKGKEAPDDNRDILALIRKPVWVEAKKRVELMEAMEVIHREFNGHYFFMGKPLPNKNVILWTEIPDGWQ